MSQQIGPLMIDLEGFQITEAEEELLNNPLIGGVIFFARNYQSPEQLRELVQAIRAVNPDLLLAVDQEGGRVQRFREGFTQLPPMRRIGQTYDDNPKQAVELAEACGWLMAIELLAVGIDFSFAPVLDLDLGVSQVIGDRAFHSNPEAVIALAQAFMHGMINAGMQPVGKHFPGHGSVEPDSHVAIPVDERPFTEVLQRDLKPFIELMPVNLPALMPAHIISPQVDSQPVGFSKTWLQTILRGEFRYKGVIFSDDLMMEGAKIVGSIKERAELALQAGCDMILVCNHRASVLELLEAWDGQEQEWMFSKRLSRMRGVTKYSREVLLDNPNWQQASELVEKWSE